MPFNNTINPTLLNIGPFEIRFYGIVYALGFLTVYYVLNKKREELRITSEQIDNLLVSMMVGMLIGARLVEVVFWEPSYYWNNPLQILMIWKGGLAFHGGFLGIVIAVYSFCKKHTIPVWKLADIMIIPATFAMALGRIANFINGELWGTITNAPWCVYFKGVDGCRHPYQLYAAAKRFLIFGMLLLLNNKEHKDGFIFWSFVVMSGIGRFFLDFLREDTRWYGLSMGQYWSFAMVIVGIYVLGSYYKKDIGLTK